MSTVASKNWIDEEIARCQCKGTKYLLRKAKLLKQLQLFNNQTLLANEKRIQAMIVREQELKHNYDFVKKNLPYGYITYKEFKIRIIKQILKYHEA